MYIGPITPPVHAGILEWNICVEKLSENSWFFAFFVVIIIDLLTGAAKCWYKNSKIKASSTIGRKGLITHFVTLFTWVIVYPLLDSWGLSSGANIVLMFFIYQYILSIIENLGQMGVKLPPYLMSRLEKLEDMYEEKYGDGSDNNKEDD